MNNWKEIDLRRLLLLLIWWNHSSVGSLKHVQFHNCFGLHYILYQLQKILGESKQKQNAFFQLLHQRIEARKWVHYTICFSGSWAYIYKQVPITIFIFFSFWSGEPLWMTNHRRHRRLKRYSGSWLHVTLVILDKDGTADEVASDLPVTLSRRSAA